MSAVHPAVAGAAASRTRGTVVAVAVVVLTAAAAPFILWEFLPAESDGAAEREREGDAQSRAACLVNMERLASELTRYRNEIGQGQRLPASLTALRASGYWTGDLRTIGCPDCRNAVTGASLGGYRMAGGGAEAGLAGLFPSGEWILVCDQVRHGGTVHVITGDLRAMAVPDKWARKQLAAQAAGAP